MKIITEDQKVWLSSLKIGDKVLRPNYRHSEMLIIVRETPTRWVVERNIQFNKVDGRIVGLSAFYRTYMQPYNEQAAQEIAKQKRDLAHESERSKLMMQIQEMSNKQLRKAIEAVKGMA